MANDGWFKCENCDHAVKALVPDWKRILDSKCPKCGGTMKKT